MTRFIEQIRSVVGAVIPIYSKSFKDFDMETETLAREMAYQVIHAAGGDVDAALGNVADAFLWWMLVGREHARRGYPAPIEGDPGSGLIPDTVGEFIDRAW